MVIYIYICNVTYNVIYNIWLIGLVGGIRISLSEVKFLDSLKTDYCESICRGCFHWSRTKVRGSKTWGGGLRRTFPEIQSSSPMTHNNIVYRTYYYYYYHHHDYCYIYLYCYYYYHCSVCMYVCTYVCMYAYVCVYMYALWHASGSSSPLPRVPHDT